MGARLQMGGSDQWGNIVNGIELGRRMDGAELYGLTTPLLTTADGAKMGKTAAGAVWLNEEQLPAYDFWQYWRNTDDRDVGRFLRLFTDLPLDEIARLEALEGSEINDAKVMLANEVTKLVRGEDAARPRRRDRAARPSPAAAWARTCPALAVRAGGMRLGAALHGDRLHRIQRRGQAQDRRRRGADRGRRSISDPGYLVELDAGDEAQAEPGQEASRPSCAELRLDDLYQLVQPFPDSNPVSGQHHSRGNEQVMAGGAQLSVTDHAARDAASGRYSGDRRASAAR